MLRKSLNAVALLLLLINGTGALYGGWSFITDPLGKRIGIPIAWLHHTPFEDFLIPGIILFLVNGVFSFVVILFILKGAKPYPLYVLMAGCLLTGWIVTQLILTRMYHPFQAVLGSIGLLLLLIGLMLFKLNKNASRYESYA